ncbi:MAG: B12-binding domain-containing radical SAM protein [Caulobacter sp.]|nr:B12-binding domain-containing radical SAM protein [Caulobacter sp.]
MASRVLLVVYDNGSHIHSFPMGAAYIAAALRQKGHEVVVWNQDSTHSPDESLTGYLDENPFDVVGIGVIGGYYQYRKLLSLAGAVNRSRRRPFFLLGGHGPTADVRYFLRKTQADAVVMGEGEETVVELVAALENRTPLTDVRGLALRDGPEVTVTPGRPLIADLDAIPWPARDLFPVEYYRLLRMPHATSADFCLPVLSGRGCTFRCTFCYRMDTGHRARASEPILDEIEYLQKTWNITYIDFMDELLMISRQRTMEFCESILRRGLKFKWYCNGRLNYAAPEVLDLMKRAGCVFINYGIESVDNTVLKNMQKALRYEQIVPGIENTLAAGISPGLNMIFGNIGDNRDTLRRAVDFLIRYDDQAELRTIRPVTPYPGSPLYDEAVRRGLLRDCEDFYEHKHLNSDLMAVNFTELTEDEFYEALAEANSRLAENYYAKSRERMLRQIDRLYRQRDATFRGFRPV